MLEILKFIVEGPINFIATILFSSFIFLFMVTLVEKFKPININYFSSQPTKREEIINE